MIAKLILLLLFCFSYKFLSPTWLNCCAVHHLHQVNIFIQWLLTETVNDVVTAALRRAHTCWQVSVWDVWKQICSHWRCIWFLLIPDSGQDSSMNTAREPPSAWGRRRYDVHGTCAPPLAQTDRMCPTSVNTSDGETLLLFAASVNRQMWRNSWFDPPEILWRTHVKGAYFAINSWRLTVLVPFATNLSIKHLTGHAGGRWKTRKGQIYQANMQRKGDETAPHPMAGLTLKCVYCTHLDQQPSFC